MNIIRAKWDSVRDGIANAVVEENGKIWIRDYCPSNPSLSYIKIRMAQLEGTLTGVLVPTSADSVTYTLDDGKRDKEASIEKRTKELLSEGISITLNGNQVRIDTVGERAQANWIKLAVLTVLVIIHILPEDMFPQDIADKEGNVITIATTTEAIQFLLNLWTTENETLSKGAHLKNQVKLASSFGELESIIDSR